MLEKEAKETRHTPSRFSLKTALTTRVFLLLVLIYFTHQFSVYGLIQPQAVDHHHIGVVQQRAVFRRGLEGMRIAVRPH